MLKRLGLLALLILAGVAVWFLVASPVGTLDPGEYDRTTVTAVDENGTQLATVAVRVADTSDKRRIGLSRTESLAANEGMLFVHDTDGSHSYIMRNMSFPLDIIFLDSSGEVTRIHHAPVPETGNGPLYHGTGQYVLEVQRDWANETGVSPGDRIEIPDDVTAEG